MDDFTHNTNEALVAVHEPTSEVDYSFYGGENTKQKHQLDNIVEELDEYYKPVEIPQDEPEGSIFIEADGFLALRYFKFTCAAPCLAFVEGAMSDVQRLKMGFNANRLEQYSPADAGFEHLSGLKEISVEIGSVGADKLDLTALESALLTSFKKQRSRTLVINLQWVHWIYHGDREMSTSLQNKNYQILPVKGVITDEQHGRKDKQVDSRYEIWF